MFVISACSCLVCVVAGLDLKWRLPLGDKPFRGMLSDCKAVSNKGGGIELTPAINRAHKLSPGKNVQGGEYCLGGWYERAVGSRRHLLVRLSLIHI